MSTNNIFKQFGIDDAKKYAPDTSIAVDNDILLLENSGHLEIPSEVLKLDFLVCCYCKEGEATFRLNSQTLEMQRGELYIGVGDQVLSKSHTTSDFRAIFILISRQCLEDSLAGLHQLWAYLIYLYKHPVVKLSEEERLWVMSSYDYIRMRLLRQHMHHYLHESVSALIRLFYFDVCHLLSCHTSPVPPKQPGSYAIFDKFIHLLGTKSKAERNVTWYSEQLCLTPKYLSEVVKGVSGQTAGQWITNFVIMDIKQLLNDTSLSIKEITQQLNFVNQSCLGKYFKNATGLSPLEYRKKYISSQKHEHTAK